MAFVKIVVTVYVDCIIVCFHMYISNPIMYAHSPNGNACGRDYDSSHDHNWWSQVLAIFTH